MIVSCQPRGRDAFRKFFWDVANTFPGCADHSSGQSEVFECLKDIFKFTLPRFRTVRAALR